MKADDFRNYVSGLSQGKKSVESRPLLADIAVAQFRRGEACFYYKRAHGDALPYEEPVDFLMAKPKQLMLRKSYLASIRVKVNSGISDSRKAGIITKLCPLMADAKRVFWENL